MNNTRARASLQATNFANLGAAIDPENYRTVLGRRPKGGAPAPSKLPRASTRGVRAPSSGKTPAPPAKPVVVPVPVPVPVTDGWAAVEDLELPVSFAPRAVEPSAPAVAAPAPVVAAKTTGPKVLRFDTGFRVEDSSAILAVVVTCHAATWIGGMVGFSTFLPLPVAIGIPTLTVWVGLALIAGLGKDSLGWVRRAAIVAFTVVNVYGSFYAWNDIMAGAGAETEMARAAHRELRADVYAPRETAAANGERDAVAAERKCEDESSQKRGGYGTRARLLCDAARDLRAAADAAKAERDALAPYFTDAVFALPPAEMWDQAALAAGVADVAAPARESYYEMPLLRALDDLRALKVEAILALVFALCIDLTGIALGRGLHHRSQS